MLKETPVIVRGSQVIGDYQIWIVECDLCKSALRVPTYSRDRQRNEESVIHFVYTRGWFIGFKTICPGCIAAIKQ